MSAIKKAAEMLRREAESMKECHTIGVCGEWYGDSVKAEYDEMIAAADAAIAECDALRAAVCHEADCVEACKAEVETLLARIEVMERQEPVAFALYSGWARNAVYLSEIEACEQRDRRQLTADLGGSLEAYRVVPLYLAPGAQPAPIVPECPYPCGWQNLLKHAIEDGAYLARSINEDEPVTENARSVTMRMVLRLRDVLMAINNAAPEAKP